jgi:DNA-3-methyladenine glycosylase
MAPGPAGSGLAGPPLAVPATGSAGLLARGFLARPSVEVAPGLLGCVLEHETAEGLVAVELTEVEAYAGQADPASHAYRGMTGRNAVMFGEAGHAYVYFTYGMHFCVNVVCERAGVASAVLLRAGRVIDGAELAAVRRSARAPRAAMQPQAGDEVISDTPDARRPATRDLARGPARLCQALDITRVQNGADLCDPSSPLRLRVPPDAVAVRSIASGPRVGVTAAADVTWRYWLSGDPTVSAYRLHKTRGR